MNELIGIENKILVIRGQQVMIDKDLAELYERFPDGFMFQLDKMEFENWKSQFVTSNSDKMGLRKKP